MDVALENLTKVSTEGARRIYPLNLSGKRTEKFFADLYQICKFCLFSLEQLNYRLFFFYTLEEEK